MGLLGKKTSEIKHPHIAGWSVKVKHIKFAQDTNTTYGRDFFPLTCEAAKLMKMWQPTL